MLIEQGDTKLLAGRAWAGLEMVSEQRIDEQVLHVARWAAEHRRDQPFQLLFPVKERGINGIKLLSPYLWARMVDLKLLNGIGSVPGVSLVRNETGPIEIDALFVQGVREQAEKAAIGWSAKIKEGSFVRVLLGSERMLCGEVLSVKKKLATVRIEMASRDLRLTIPTGALLVLRVRKENRKYYCREENQ